MEKPAIVTITDDNNEVVYMQFIDMEFVDLYKRELAKMSEDVVVLETDTGETFYSMPSYIQNLLRKGTKSD